jgi:hypothetical protein
MNGGRQCSFEFQSRRATAEPGQAAREIPMLIAGLTHSEATMLKKVGPVPDTYATPPRKCLWCRKHLDKATNVTDVTEPKDGDVTICAGCGHVMVFTAGLDLRKPTKEELDALQADSRFCTIMQVSTHVIGPKRERPT